MVDIAFHELEEGKDIEMSYPVVFIKKKYDPVTRVKLNGIVDELESFNVAITDKESARRFAERMRDYKRDKVLYIKTLDSEQKIIVVSPGYRLRRCSKMQVQIKPVERKSNRN